MRGKKTNITIGVTNILLGLLFILYLVMYNSNFETFTRYNNQIFNIIKITLLVILGIVALLNLIYAIINIKEGHIFIYYIVMLFSLILFVSVRYVYTIPTILSGILLIIYIRRSNFIEQDSNAVITINTLMYIAFFVIALMILLYKPLSSYAMERESVDLLKYDQEFFKYVTPVEDEDIYINIRIGDKYGYINNRGETKIDFTYEFATPYYNIYAYDKEFKVAGVTNDNVMHIIMKNGREVMSYNSEYENNNYLSKLEEFEDVLKNTMTQENPKPESNKDLTYFAKKDRIIEETEEEKAIKEELGYTYMFDFSKRYNVIVIESSMGNRPIYKIAPKKNIREAKELDVDNLLYDENSLYVFKNGFLPYFSVARGVQGWITKTGKKFNVEGKVQILDIEEDRLLVRNFNKNTVSFIDFDAKPVGESYEEVIKDDDRYIVKNAEGKWTVLNKNLTPILENTYDVFDPTLLNAGLYIFANLGDSLDFNEHGYVQLDYVVTNRDFKPIATEARYIYNIYHRYTGQDEESYVEFVEELKKSNISVESDKFYTNYIERNKDIESENREHREEKQEDKNEQVEKQEVQEQDNSNNNQEEQPEQQSNEEVNTNTQYIS